MSGNNFLNSFIHLHIAFEVVSVGNVALCNLLRNGGKLRVKFILHHFIMFCILDTEQDEYAHSLDQPFVPKCTVHRSYSLHIAILLFLLA